MARKKKRCFNWIRRAENISQQALMSAVWLNLQNARSIFAFARIHIFAWQSLFSWIFDILKIVFAYNYFICVRCSVHLQLKQLMALFWIGQLEFELICRFNVSIIPNIHSNILGHKSIGILIFTVWYTSLLFSYVYIFQWMNEWT